MATKVRLPDDLHERIDAVRGDVPRERWVRRTLEAALSEAQGSIPGNVVVGRSEKPAPSPWAALGKGPVRPRPKGKP